MTALTKVEKLNFEITPEQIELIKNTVCKGATNDELSIFMHMCKRTGLDPFAKQIHAVKRWTDGKEVMTIQTGIDGYRLIAERTRKYAPGREPTYMHDKDGRLISATAFVKKQTDDGTWHEISATAFFQEYAQTKKDGSLTKFWSKMPYGQTAKCAEALALRRAFPQELSGIYTIDEMAQADNDMVTVPTEEIIFANSDALVSQVISQEQASEIYSHLQNGDKEIKNQINNYLKANNFKNVRSITLDHHSIIDDMIKKHKESLKVVDLMEAE